jgi:hypothetical protein
MAKIGFQLTSDQPDDVSGRAWRKAMVAGWFAVGVYHDEVVQPRKFQRDAASRYKYQARSPRYVARKKRIAARSWRVKDGGERELVYSGITRTIVLRRQYPRAFPTRVWVELPTPSYIQMRPRSSRWSMPAMGVELISIAQDEYQEAEKIYLETVEKTVQFTRERRVQRI